MSNERSFLVMQTTQCCFPLVWKHEVSLVINGKILVLFFDLDKGRHESLHEIIVENLNFEMLSVWWTTHFVSSLNSSLSILTKHVIFDYVFLTFFKPQRLFVGRHIQAKARLQVRNVNLWL